MVYVKNKFYIEKDALRSLYDELGSLNNVAANLGISKKLVLNWMKHYDIPRQPSNHNKDTHLKVAELASIGLSSADIGKKLGITQDGVLRAAKKSGVKIKDKYHRGFIESGGYILIKSPDASNPNNKGYVKEHRVVMERYLGRNLTENEIVHHIDGNKKNNSIDNLELMLLSEHTRLHHKGKKGRGKDKGPRKRLKI